MRRLSGQHTQRRRELQQWGNMSASAQENGGFDVVPGSELVVGRVAHRNNQSDYYIDARKRQQKDVVARLLQEGIDLDNNRFLILQAHALLLEFLFGGIR